MLMSMASSTATSSRRTCCAMPPSVVKVADLGLAQLSNSDSSGPNASLTQAGSILGTVDYMRPNRHLMPRLSTAESTSTASGARFSSCWRAGPCTQPARSWRFC